MKSTAETNPLYGRRAVSNKLNSRKLARLQFEARLDELLLEVDERSCIAIDQMRSDGLTLEPLYQCIVTDSEATHLCVNPHHPLCGGQDSNDSFSHLYYKSLASISCLGCIDAHERGHNHAIKTGIPDSLNLLGPLECINYSQLRTEFETSWPYTYESIDPFIEDKTNFFVTQALALHHSIWTETGPERTTLGPGWAGLANLVSRYRDHRPYADQEKTDKIINSISTICQHRSELERKRLRGEL